MCRGPREGGRLQFQIEWLGQGAQKMASYFKTRAGFGRTKTSISLCSIYRFSNGNLLVASELQSQKVISSDARWHQHQSVGILLRSTFLAHVIEPWCLGKKKKSYLKIITRQIYRHYYYVTNCILIYLNSLKKALFLMETFIHWNRVIQWIPIHPLLSFSHY